MVDVGAVQRTSVYMMVMRRMDAMLYVGVSTNWSVGGDEAGLPACRVVVRLVVVQVMTDIHMLGLK